MSLINREITEADFTEISEEEFRNHLLGLDKEKEENIIIDKDKNKEEYYINKINKLKDENKLLKQFIISLLKK